MEHTWDDDGVCFNCGRDGAEWAHYRDMFPDEYKDAKLCLPQE